MPLVEPVIRPPSEAESFLLQVTTGCSSMSCTFCGAYRGKPYRIKERAEIDGDIDEWRDISPETERVFLLDGDALAAGNAFLVPILKRLSDSFPGLRRISSYANGRNITPRSNDELRELCANGLSLIYMGLESGSQAVLDRCRKRSSAEEMVLAVQRAGGAGIKSSIIVLLGLGGKDLSDDHVEETAAALNRMQPRYLSFLTLMLIPGTPLHRQADEGSFALPGQVKMLKEARDIIARLELQGTIFRSNHASNYLPLAGRFPRDKKRLVDTLDEALKGNTPLRPESFRAF